MKRGLTAIVTMTVLLFGALAAVGSSALAATLVGPQNVSGDAELSILPRVAQDPDGNLHVVWDEQDDRRVLYAKGTWNGSSYTWGPKYVIGDVEGDFAYATPNVAVAPNGQIMVTWTVLDDDELVGLARVWDSRASEPGGSPVSLGTGIQSAVAADADNRFHIVWNGDFKIQYCMWTSGTGCDRYDVFGEEDTSNNNPDIAVDSTGAVHVVWHLAGSGIQYRVRPKNGEWGAISELDSGNFATIGADNQGYVHIAWSRDFDAQYCRKTASSGCDERTAFSTGDDIRPSIGATPSGDVLLVYQENQGKTLQYVVRESGRWSTPAKIGERITPPDVTGRAYTPRLSAVWSGDYDIQAATLVFGAVQPTAVPTTSPTTVPPTPVPTVAPTPTPPPDARFFPETGYYIYGPIRQYWERNGGLAVFGLPLNNQALRDTPDGRYEVQLFERERLEVHPQNQPPFDVQLGRLGSDLLARQGRPWQSLPREQPRDGCMYFPETQHNVCEPFLTYWRSFGVDLGEPGVTYGESLTLFGLPLSTRTVETNPDGDTVETQWFERARFEYHPDNPDPFKVLLGRLGAEAGLQ